MMQIGGLSLDRAVSPQGLDDTTGKSSRGTLSLDLRAPHSSISVEISFVNCEKKGNSVDSASKDPAS